MNPDAARTRRPVAAPHPHPDAITIDPKDPIELKLAARVAGDRWRAGWRVRPCATQGCKMWQWHRPAEDDAGDPTGGR